MKEHEKQANDYSFLRQLTKQAPETELAVMIETLQEEGVELYRKEEEGFSLISFGNEANETVTDGCLYISAADRDAAVQILQKAGLGGCISEAHLVSKGKSLVEEAEEEYLKRRKMRMMECLVVVVLALLYYLYKMS